MSTREVPVSVLVPVDNEEKTATVVVEKVPTLCNHKRGTSPNARR